MSERLNHILDFALRQPNGWSLMTNEDLIEIKKELLMVGTLKETIESLKRQLMDAEIRYASTVDL